MSRRARLVAIAPCVALAVLGQLLGDCFPLSSWPMYEAPGPHRGVVFVVDGQGRPLSLEGSGWSAARLQKRLVATARRGDPAPVAGVRAALLDDARRLGHPLPDDLRLGWLAIEVADDGKGLRVSERAGPLADPP
jgi:hypothetical protein